MINALYICTDWDEVEGSTASLVNMIHATRDTVHPIVLLSHHGKVENYLHELGIETVVAPFFYLWEQPKRLITALHHPTRATLYRRLTLNGQCCRKVVQQLNNQRIDIVHSNTTVADIGVLFAQRLNAKHVWHIRESLEHLNIHPYGGMQRLRHLIEQADARIVISNALRNHWQLPKENTFVIHDAIFPSLPQNIETRRQKQILFCAAELNDFKGTSLAVEAFCKANLDDYRLVLTGNCSKPYQTQLLNLAAEYNMSDKLDFVGYQNNMEPFYCSSSAFLMCSKFEGLGRVTLEAMAYGCPVVALATGGTTDFIHDGETGWFFTTADECAKLLQQITSSDNSHLVQSARELIASEYTESVYGQHITNLYNSLIP